MMTIDDKRRLESIFAKFGLSRKARHKAVGAVTEWLNASAAQPKNVKADAAAGKELIATLRHTRELLVESKEKAT